jgi:hypothetical protein
VLSRIEGDLNLTTLKLRWENAKNFNEFDGRLTASAAFGPSRHFATMQHLGRFRSEADVEPDYKRTA